MSEEKAISPIVGPDGQPARAEPFREPTPAELRSTDIRTPHQHEKRVRLRCPTGRVLNGTIEFEDGTEVMNVLRAVIALDPNVPDGAARVFITRFNNEIGKVVYEEALALVG